MHRMRWLAVLFTGLFAAPIAAQERAVVAAVNYPLAYFAERVGAGSVDVLFSVPVGTDPAFWRPGISDIAAIQSADVIALNGADYATWTTKASLPRSRLVNTSRAFASEYIPTETVTHSHGDGGEHSHTGVATYTWLDFELANQQADALTAAMARRMPGEADALYDRLGALTEDLNALDALATEVGAALQGRTIIASHPRYQYFARAYGLEIDAMEWEPGAMPSDAQWEDLASRLSGATSPLFLWEAEPPEDAIARAESLGLASVVFDPLAQAPTDGQDFVEAMRETLSRLSASAS